VSAFGIALVEDALGEKELALAALERAYKEHAVEFAYSEIDSLPSTAAIESRDRCDARGKGSTTDP